MVKKCVVPNCPHTQHKNPELSFFAVTPIKEQRLKWIEAIELNVGNFDGNLLKHPNATICSAHFRPEDIHCPSPNGLRYRKKTAIPSIFNDTSANIYASNLDNETLKLCRICLKAQGNSELTLNHTLPNSTIPIKAAVKKAFDIDLDLKSGYPQTICPRCYNLVITSYVLKLEIIKTTMKLNEMVRGNSQWTMQEPPKKSHKIIKTYEQPALQIQSNNVEVKTEPEEIVEVQEQKIFAESLPSQFRDDEVLINIKQEEQSDDDGNIQYIAIVQDDGDETPIDVNELIRIATVKEKNPPKMIQKPPIIVDKKWKKCENPVQKLKKKVPKYEEWPKKLVQRTYRERIDRQKCNKCDFMAGHTLDIFRHVDESKENCIELYQPTQECYICHKKFMLLTMKIKHVKNYHKDMELSGKCEKCGKEENQFKQPFLYERHLQSHYAPPKYPCSKCDQGFSKKEQYDQHMMTHIEKLYSCDLCDYREATKVLIRIHMEKHKQ